MSMYVSPYEALKAAVAAAGTQEDLALICGVSQPAVWRWLHIAKPLPAEYVLRVEAATGISRHDLRPDIYPLEHTSSPVFYGVDNADGCVSFNKMAELQGKVAA